jgi:hypothetical protein
MKIIINENQLKQIIESGNKRKLMSIPIKLFVDNADAILDNYYKKGFDDIKLIGDVGFYFVAFISMGFDKLFEHIIEVDGNLDLSGASIKSLGNLESVSGLLDLDHCKELESLGNLKYVGDYLALRNTNITTLSNLEYVGHYLLLRGTQIEDLGKLKYVGGDVSLMDVISLTSLGNLEEVGGYLMLDGTNIKSLGNLRKVGDYLKLYATPIKSLDNLEYVGGDLDLYISKIESLGKLKYVGGELNVRRTPLAQRMSEDEIKNNIEVKGEIYL